MQACRESANENNELKIAREALRGRGMNAWLALLQAHAALLRRLTGELAAETGMTLGDFDVLAHLAQAGGELRMTELAARAFSSRSNMTRRIDRLVDEGLVCRQVDDIDGRGVVVCLTGSGVARFAETAPVHRRGIDKLFTGKLTDDELAHLEQILANVRPDASFG